MLLIGYIGVFLILANTIRHWRQLRLAAAFILASGFLMALVGVLHKLSGSREVFWFQTPRYGGDIFGPFSNRNHFAAHMNLLFGLGLGLFLSSSRLREVMAWQDWRDRIAWLSRRRAGRMGLTVFALAFIGGAIFMSLSRGAIISLVFALGLLSLRLVTLEKGGMRARLRLLPVLLLLAAAVLWFGWRPVMDRLSTLADAAQQGLGNTRSLATAATLRMFCRAPLFGAGFGTFRHVFPLFQDRPLQIGRFGHAHNDWAQLLAEGGLLTAAVFLVLLCLFYRLVSPSLRRPAGGADLFVLGAATGLAATALHSLFDYSLHRPANMFLLSAVGGLIAAAAHLSRLETAGNRRRSSPSRKARPAAGNDGARQRNGRRRSAHRLHTAMAGPGRLLVFVIFFAMLTLLVVQHNELRGELAFMRCLFLEKQAHKCASPEDLHRAMSAARFEAALMTAHCTTNPDNQHEAAETLFMWLDDRRLPRSLRLQLAATAMDCAEAAARQASSDFIAWLWLARIQAASGRWNDAELCLARARALVMPGRRVRMFDRRR
jgi:O-antigen ligase